MALESRKESGLRRGIRLGSGRSRFLRRAARRGTELAPDVDDIKPLPEENSGKLLSGAAAGDVLPDPRPPLVAQRLLQHRGMVQHERLFAVQITARTEVLVGAARFELATTCTPCRYATRLRYAPKSGILPLQLVENRTQLAFDRADVDAAHGGLRTAASRDGLGPLIVRVPIV